MSYTSFWAFLGTLYLIIYTIELFRKKCIIDERKQYFMMGLSVALYNFIHYDLWFMFVILGVIILLNIILSYKNYLFQVDIVAISWIFTGIIIINMFYILWFLIIFLTLGVIYLGLKQFVFKTEQKKIYIYPCILLSFIIFCLTMGFY